MDKEPLIRATQKVRDGLEAVFYFITTDGIEIDVNFEPVETDGNGKYTANMTAGDEFGFEHATQQVVPFPNEIDNENPIITEDEETEHRTRNKIIVGATIGALLAGATYKGVRYSLKQRKKP